MTIESKVTKIIIKYLDDHASSSDNDSEVVSFQVSLGLNVRSFTERFHIQQPEEQTSEKPQGLDSGPLSENWDEFEPDAKELIRTLFERGTYDPNGDGGNLTQKLLQDMTVFKVDDSTPTYIIVETEESSGDITLHTGTTKKPIKPLLLSINAIIQK